MRATDPTRPLMSLPLAFRSVSWYHLRATFRNKNNNTYDNASGFVSFVLLDLNKFLGGQNIRLTTQWNRWILKLHWLMGDKDSSIWPFLEWDGQISMDIFHHQLSIPFVLKTLLDDVSKRPTRLFNGPRTLLSHEGWIRWSM